MHFYYPDDIRAISLYHGIGGYCFLFCFLFCLFLFCSSSFCWKFVWKFCSTTITHQKVLESFRFMLKVITQETLQLWWKVMTFKKCNSIIASLMLVRANYSRRLVKLVSWKIFRYTKASVSTIVLHNKLEIKTWDLNHYTVNSRHEISVIFFKLVVHYLDLDWLEKAISPLAWQVIAIHCFLFKWRCHTLYMQI